MARHSSKWALAALSLAVLAPLVACSSAPTEPHGASGATPASAPAPEALTSEADRVHEYLEGRYPSAAVRHSFRTALGQTMECVDFFQMPGVRAMAARGEPITAIPTPPPPRARRRRDGSTVMDRSQPAPVSEGVDEDGHERLCPEGTVLQLRVTADDVAREGGLDAYRHARQKHPPSRVPRASAQPRPFASADAPMTPATAPPTMWPCASGEFHDYAHVIADVVDTTPGVVLAMDEMAVYAPPIPQAGGNHTVGQVWLFGGTIAQDLSTDPPCNPATQACVQSIEIGWMESAGSSNANIFTYSTLDGYTVGPGGADLNGCWNGEGGGNCPTFIWSSGYPSSVVPGMPIPVSAPYSTPQELSALVIEISNDYWVQIGIGGSRYYIGYYPASNFSAVLGPNPMSTFQVGGEVYGANNDFTNPAIPMGSGLPASWGYGYAAYHHDFNAEVWVNGQQSNYYDATSMCASTPPDYSYAPYGYDTTAPPGSSSWATDGGYFYYGGTPSSCSPTTCAAQGATCGTIANDCGSTLSCGTCGTGTTCVGNVCKCRAQPCPVMRYWNYDTCSCVRRILF